MARYLTPAKIGLLVLIELYTEAVVPTTSTIPILSFIISHLLPSSLPKPHNILPGEQQRDSSCNFIITIEDYKRLLSVYPSASGVPGRTLWDLFLKKLWAVDSLHALHEFFDHRPILLTKTREESQKDTEVGIIPPHEDTILISRTSPLGAFIRRAHLEFTRLKFHDALKLWKSFISYRQPTLAAWKKRNPQIGNFSFDSVLHEADEEWEPDALEQVANVAYGDFLSGQNGGSEFISTDDVEKLLEFQIEQMQKLGSRVPEGLQDQFKNLLDSNIVMPSLSHYVSFLDAWRAGDYPTSFDNLHRFFDYTMQNRDRTFYQYALLNLAVLQADFGCYEEAVAAMQETVSTARENKDMNCLNFSLSWLYHFGKSHPNVINDSDKANILGVEREGLAFLRVKAKESGMWSLWSSSLLSEAKMGLSSGESVATAFENILRSSQLSVSKNMMSNIGTQMMLQLSLWSRLGNAHLAWSYSEVFLRCHSKLAPFDDILKFTCLAAYLLARRGKYSDAMTKLESLDPNSLRSLKSNQYWIRFRGILRLQHDLHRNNLEGADQLLVQLLQCRGGDPDLTFELNILHMEAIERRGDYNRALAKIDEIATEFKDHRDDILFHIRLLIMKSHILDKCGRPQRGFSVAIKAAAMAWRAHLLPALWQAMGAVANILTSLGEFEASSQILVSVLPRVLECEDCAVNAQLFSYLVDAHMGMAGQAESESLKRTEHLTKSLDFIDRAFAEYSSVKDIEGQCEMMAKKAFIMRLVGDLVLANDYAAAYLDLKKEAATET